MSKIGKKNITIPKDSSIKIEAGSLTISGPKGTKKLTINDKIFTSKLDDSELVKIKSVIDSMTEKERNLPQLISQSRAQRIAKGSGRSLNDVSQLLKNFRKMQQMMGKMSKGFGGLMSKIPGLDRMLGSGNQSDLAQLAQQMGAGGGGMPQASGAPRPVDRNKLKKVRKAARQNRKRNRRR